MSTKYSVIVVNPKRRTNTHVHVLKSGMSDSTEADNLKNSYIAQNPGVTAANVQKITYTDAP